MEDFVQDAVPHRLPEAQGQQPAELDLETAPARVGYLAAPGTAGGGFIRFCDDTGSPWFDAPRPASPPTPGRSRSSGPVRIRRRTAPPAEAKTRRRLQAHRAAGRSENTPQTSGAPRRFGWAAQ